MSTDWFDKVIKPKLNGCEFFYSSFPEGDFGSLERIEVKKTHKMATVDFWSKGWVSCDVYDCFLDDQDMNILISPDEKELVSQVFERFIKIMQE